MRGGQIQAAQFMWWDGNEEGMGNSSRCAVFLRGRHLNSRLRKQAPTLVLQVAGFKSRPPEARRRPSFTRDSSVHLSLHLPPAPE